MESKNDAIGTNAKLAARVANDAFGAKAEVGQGTGNDVRDPGCVKTLRGIIAPGILGSVVMRRAKKRKNLSSARHYDQIRFGFHTTKTRNGHLQ
jgi:hypothetical protein